MKFKVTRYGIEIVPEDDQDEAYIEDTLGLKNDCEFIRLYRKNVIGLSCIGLLTTRVFHPERAKDVTKL